MKRITLIIISLMLCLLFTACGDSETTSDIYKSFICDYANDGMITSAERDWWLRNETSPSTLEEKKVTFEGIEYRAFYDESTRPAGRHNVRDKYVTEDGRVRLHFNSLSGDFSGIFFIGAVTEKYDEADIENSHDKALEKAKLLASKYIDLDEYVLTEEQYSYYRGGEENAKIGPLGEGRVIVYKFTFTKEQNDFKTSDAVFINITSKGDLRSFHAFDKGLFSQRKVPKIDKDKLSQSIDEKLKKIYSGYKYTYEIVKQTLTLSPEEKVIVVSHIELDITDKYRTAIGLVTEIE